MSVHTFLFGARRLLAALSASADNMPARIGKLQFKSIKAAQAHTRGVIKQVWQGRGAGRVAAVGVHDPDFEFFQTLIANHPEHFRKFGLGVRGFEVRENRLARGALGMYADVVGHGLVDFSWLVCCGAKPPCSLRSAMRMAVRQSTAEFRQHAPPACVLCAAGGTLHVDHAQPTFRELAGAFVAANRPPTEFDSHPELHMAVFRSVDKEYARRWQRHHDEHATLRMLCATCNLTRRRT